jgi:hypothetical protein
LDQQRRRLLLPSLSGEDGVGDPVGGSVQGLIAQFPAIRPHRSAVGMLANLFLESFRDRLLDLFPREADEAW